MEFKKPKRISEANIQAEFYKQCRDSNINVYLEYKYEKCRFDAIIHKNGEIILIVEVKSYRSRRKPNINTKQIKKYKQYNIPVILITRLSDVEPTVRKICRFYVQSITGNKRKVQG